MAGAMCFSFVSSLNPTCTHRLTEARGGGGGRGMDSTSKKTFPISTISPSYQRLSTFYDIVTTLYRRQKRQNIASTFFRRRSDVM